MPDGPDHDPQPAGRTCPCGRPARPIVAIILAAPLAVGVLFAAAQLLARGTPLQAAASIATHVAFAGLAALVLWFGWRVLSGRICAGCGRGLPSGGRGGDPAGG